jgi:HTH-type transcriptional regulator / antitoxin HipB
VETLLILSIMRTNGAEMEENKDITIKDTQFIGRLIKKRRKELGITQRQLADMSGLSFNGISQVELGRMEIRISSLIKIGQLLGLKLKIEVEN